MIDQRPGQDLAQQRGLLWLQQHERLSVDEMAEALEHESGLLGLAGTPDMRELLARAEREICDPIDVPEIQQARRLLGVA